MCQRVICQMKIGSLSQEDLKVEGPCSDGYKLWAREISIDDLKEESVELVGVRCCQFGFDNVTPTEDFFRAALKSGLEFCPIHLPFDYLKQFGGKGGETFVFATEPRTVSVNRGGGAWGRDILTNGFLSTHHYHGASYAINQPYGSGVEFAFIKRH